MGKILAKMIKLIFVLLLLWVCLTLTNPTMEDYKVHLKIKVQGTSDNVFAQVGSYVLSEAAAPLVERQDYKVFSIYVLRDPFGGVYKTLGIMKLLIDL